MLYTNKQVAVSKKTEKYLRKTGVYSPSLSRTTTNMVDSMIANGKGDGEITKVIKAFAITQGVELLHTRDAYRMGVKKNQLLGLECYGRHWFVPDNTSQRIQGGYYAKADILKLKRKMKVENMTFLGF
jgi:hypothetical protein